MCFNIISHFCLENPPVASLESKQFKCLLSFSNVLLHKETERYRAGLAQR